MSKMIIAGGSPKLKGEVLIEGSKNAVLPILAATLLNGGISVIKNCPKLRDVDITLKILIKLGCSVKIEKNAVIIDSSIIKSTDIPVDLATDLCCLDVKKLQLVFQEDVRLVQGL